MPSRLRSALVLGLIVASQVGMTFGALSLCDVRTERDQFRILCVTSGDPDLWEPRWWDFYFYRGYPVPWAEYREGHFGKEPEWDAAERSEPAVVARNWAVPACSVVLALGLPVLLASEIARGWARLRGSPERARIRGGCGLWAIILAAGGGLTAALLDVATDPQGAPDRVGNVPFDRPPGQWLRVPSPTGSAYLVDPPQVQWLRNERGKWFPPEHGDCCDPDFLAREWAGRTRRTVYGVVLGAVFGCVLVRPWRRTGRSGKPDADGTSGPPGEHPFTSGPTAL